MRFAHLSSLILTLSTLSAAALAAEVLVPQPSSESAKDDKKEEKKDDKKEEKKDPQPAPAEESSEGDLTDIGAEEAGDNMPGREGGGGSSEIVGPQEEIPALGAPNIDGSPKVKITLRNGTLLEGKLTHVFKGSDKWNASPQPSSEFTINVDTHELALEWKSIKTITGKDANPSSDVDCWTNQDAVPLEYECTLAQPTFVKMKGTHQYSGDYKIVDKEPYVLVLDGDAKKVAMLYLYKIPLKIQDDGTPESEALAKLQVELKARNQKGVRSIVAE